MANTIITPQIFTNEVLRNLDKEVVFLAHTNRKYEGEIKKAGDTVRVQTLPTLTFTASSISGAGDCASSAVGSGPGGSIAASDFAITVESLTINKFTEKRIILTDLEMTQSNLNLEEKVGKRFSEGISSLLEDQVRDQILVEQISDIPAANKINSATPITLTTANVYGEIMKLRDALRKQNVKVKNMKLFISTDVETLLLQSDFVKGSDAGVGIMKNGYLGTVGGVPVYVSTSLDASKEMIMMAEGAVNTAVQIVKTKVVDGADGFYTNIMATVVWGMKIFGENAKAIAVNYVA